MLDIMFNGLNSNLNDLTKLSNAQTRSISPENFTGARSNGGKSIDGPAKECARDLGQGWKISPYVNIKPNEVYEVANVKDCGAITHIWMTPEGMFRNHILRIYWDDMEYPSVECPLGDFFLNGTTQYRQINSIPINVNPLSGLNSYFIMPFRKGFRITIENLDSVEMTLFYQVDYVLTDVDNDMAYLHAKFNRVNPLPYKEVYTILDDIQGKGHYVGTYLIWGSNNNGWWGEGEVKMYIDDDDHFPTICGTGTEDYFCGSYGFYNKDRKYQEYSTPYTGFFDLTEYDSTKRSQTRFSMYRFHITDPIRFENKIKVTIQALGWRKDGRYLPLKDDISSVAFWYQTIPHKEFSINLDIDHLEII